jgi:hypothetical protein
MRCRWAAATGQQQHGLTLAHARAVLADLQRLMWLPGQRQHAWEHIQQLFTEHQLPALNAAHFLVTATERLASGGLLNLQEQTFLLQVPPSCANWPLKCYVYRKISPACTFTNTACWRPSPQIILKEGLVIRPPERHPCSRLSVDWTLLQIGCFAPFAGRHKLAQEGQAARAGSRGAPGPAQKIGKGAAALVSSPGAQRCACQPAETPEGAPACAMGI